MAKIYTVAKIGEYTINVKHDNSMYHVYLNDRLYGSCSEYEQCRKNVKEIVGDYAAHNLDGMLPELMTK